jgi:hypothetical protein
MQKTVKKANSRYEALATFKHYCPKGNEHEANIQGERKIGKQQIVTT